MPETVEHALAGHADDAGPMTEIDRGSVFVARPVGTDRDARRFVVALAGCIRHAERQRRDLQSAAMHDEICQGLGEEPAALANVVKNLLVRRDGVVEILERKDVPRGREETVIEHHRVAKEFVLAPPRVVDIFVARARDDEFKTTWLQPAEDVRKIPKEDDIDVEIDNLVERQSQREKLAQAPAMAGIERIESTRERIQLGAVDIDDFDAINFRRSAGAFQIVVIGNDVERYGRARRQIAFKEWQQPIDDAIIGDDGNPIIFGCRRFFQHQWPFARKMREPKKQSFDMESTLMASAVI